MTRVLCLSDTHIGAGYEHRKDALADTAAMFTQVVTLAEERGVDLILHAGDVFHRAKPSPGELHVFKTFCDSLAELRIPMAAIGGNGAHEAAAGEKSALELFASDWVYVSRKPEIAYQDAVTVCTLPAAPFARQVGEDAVDLLLQTARDLYTQAPSDQPRILLAHQMVSGAYLPTGLPVEQIGSAVLPLWALEEIGYDAIVLGDIHLSQLMSATGRIWYCGSPMTMDFGEAEVVHGVWLWDSESEHTFPKFAELSDRRFVTIAVDLTSMQLLEETSRSYIENGDASFSVTATRAEALDESDRIAAAISERLPLADAIVRVRYRASEEQHRRVDHAALAKLVSDAGAHRLYGGIAWEPVRETRTRAETLDESVGPLEAIDLWLAAQSMNGADGEGLRALTAAYLEATR